MQDTLLQRQIPRNELVSASTNWSSYTEAQITGKNGMWKLLVFGGSHLGPSDSVSYPCDPDGWINANVSVPPIDPARGASRVLLVATPDLFIARAYVDSNGAITWRSCSDGLMDLPVTHYMPPLVPSAIPTPNWPPQMTEEAEHLHLVLVDNGVLRIARRLNSTDWETDGFVDGHIRFVHATPPALPNQAPGGTADHLRKWSPASSL